METKTVTVVINWPRNTFLQNLVVHIVLPLCIGSLPIMFMHGHNALSKLFQVLGFLVLPNWRSDALTLQQVIRPDRRNLLGRLACFG